MARNSSQFDCSRCPWGQHCDHDRAWPGSRGPAPYAQWVVTHRGRTVVESRTCLLPMLDPEYIGLVDLHHHYQSHVLPFAGGVLEQPAFYLDAMMLITNAIGEAPDDR